jgi:tRNA U34 5-carboxymethylaminomethyl modifying GTPase MnmE/TrmE
VAGARVRSADRTSGVEQRPSPSRARRASRPISFCGSSDASRATLARRDPIRDARFPSRCRAILVWSKVDLSMHAGQAEQIGSELRARRRNRAPTRAWRSSLRAVGLEDLRACTRARARPENRSRRRPRARRPRAASASVRALPPPSSIAGSRGSRAGAPLELSGILRAATSALTRASPDSDAAAILDRLFARFCLGK